MKKRRTFQTPTKNRYHIIKRAMLEVLVEEGGQVAFTDLFDKTNVKPAVREAYPTANEEMMRLRCYEQLQDLATSGKVTKDKRNYEITDEGRKEVEGE